VSTRNTDFASFAAQRPLSSPRSTRVDQPVAPGELLGLLAAASAGMIGLATDRLWLAYIGGAFGKALAPTGRARSPGWWRAELAVARRYAPAPRGPAPKPVRRLSPAGGAEDGARVDVENPSSFDGFEG
jgi:hypothetical protein